MSDLNQSDSLRLEKTSDFRADLHSEDFREKIKNRYGDFIDTLPIIIYVVEPHPPYSPIYISRGIGMLGYTEDDWYQTKDLWISIIHEDDREAVLRETAKAISGGREFDYEYRIYARDGSILWFHDKGNFIRDPKGKLLTWEGFLLDITQRKNREQESVADKNLESQKTVESTPINSILLVEDEEIVRELVRQILLSSNFAVTTAADGLDALEICRATGKNFDLLITDLSMPRMGGLELSEKIKEIFREIKVLYISGYTDDLDFLSNIAASERHFIAKPFLPQDLIEKIKAMLDPQ